MRTLRTFAAVAAAGSFAGHARDLGVDPSSVSRDVAALEAEVGVRLFERTTRRLSLTEAGRLYLDRIRPLLDELAAAREVALDAVEKPSGLLRISASVAFAERWLMPRIAGFRQAYPGIEIDMRVTDAVVDLAAEGVDLAVRLGPRIEGDAIVSKLFDTRYRVVASPAYLARCGRPAEPANLTDRDCVVFPFAGYRSHWRFRTERDHPVETVRPKAVLTISNALTIRRAVLDGVGVALLADWSIADDLASGTLIDLFPEHEASAADFDTAAWIVYPSRSYVPFKVRALIDYLKSAIR